MVEDDFCHYLKLSFSFVLLYSFSFLVLHTVCGLHTPYISDVLGERHGW